MSSPYGIKYRTYLESPQRRHLPNTGIVRKSVYPQIVLVLLSNKKVLFETEILPFFEQYPKTQLVISF